MTAEPREVPAGRWAAAADAADHRDTPLAHRYSPCSIPIVASTGWVVSVGR